MPYEPLHHKYRPQTFAELVGQESIATTLTNALRQQRIAPAYLFTGARGTGKTSSARILAKSLNCLESSTPTEKPCGNCEVCRMIAKGLALDVIEIDAASNTGVDHIRELIERAQFAPVQCRYKVYAIDECLTGDTLVSTREGTQRIDDPAIVGKPVLSYNDATGTWEYKTVTRWFDQGKRPTLVITTTQHMIKCTDNHLIRTEQGWIRAIDLKVGMKILSPQVASQPATSKPVIHSLEKFLLWLNLMGTEKLSHWTGSIELLQKDWLGGTWTTVPLNTSGGDVQEFDCILKGSLMQKTSLLLNGSQDWATQPRHSTESLIVARSIPSFNWAQSLPENGWQISNNTPLPQWATSLEKIESIEPGEIEPVYDIEVEENHNFVGNGLTLHNCHMLSQAAFNALLKTLEEPPDRVVFVLATTDPQRVLPTIISRCQRFDFRRIPLEAMVQHMGQIADKEAIDITLDAVQLVSQISQGGLRDAQSLLDQLSLLEGQITAERVWDLVGAVPERDLLALVQAITQDDATTVIDRGRHLMDRGREPLIVLQNLASFYRDLLIAKTSPDRQDLVAVTSSTWMEMCELTQALDIGTILQGQQHLRQSEGQVKNTTQPRLWLEVTLMGLLPSAFGAGREQRTEGRGQEKRSIETFVQGRQPQAEPPQLPSAKILQPGMAESVAMQAETGIQPEAELAQATAETGHEPIESIAAATLEIQEVEQIQQSSSLDLEQIWETVIAQIKFRGTQVLLQQQALLLAFDGREARIGIKSQPLFQMAKKQITNIEGAFEAVYQQKVRVSLEVKAAAESSPRSPAETSNGATSASPHLPHKPVARESPASPSPSVTSTQSTSRSSARYLPSPAVVDPPASDAPEALQPPASPAWQEEDEVKGAARSVAQFFNGEIVSLEDEPSIALPQNDPPLISAATDIDEGDGEPDEDVPF